MEVNLIPQDANTLKTFAVNKTFVWGYVYHKLLGHEIEHIEC